MTAVGGLILLAAERAAGRPPLAGKTTLAPEIVRQAAETAVLVENDAVRRHLASEMSDEEPRYRIAEHEDA